LFVALHFEDVGSYISWDCTIQLILNTAKHLNLDESSQLNAFLVSLSIFPTSYLQITTPELVSIFASDGAVDIVAAIMALAFSSHHHAFFDVTSRELFEHRIAILEKQRRAMIDKIGALMETEAARYGYKREIILADLNTISAPPHEDRPAWVARTLCALLHRGRHPSFISEQIKSLSSSTVPLVIDGLMQALKLMQCLPPSAVDHLEPRIEGLKQHLRACNRTDVETCRRLADAVMDELWDSSIHKNHFIYPKLLFKNLKDGIIPMISSFPDSGIRPEHIIILPCDETTLDCEAFAPGKITLTSHVQNLIINPFKHYPMEKFKVEEHRSPVAIAYLKIDEIQERLLLVVADRSKPPIRENLWTLIHGLSNVRASMQIFGGDVEYCPSGNNLEKHQYGPTLKQIEECRKRKIDLSVYQNMFVTAFSLMRRNL